MENTMGLAASKVGKPNGIIVTLDALGTLYKFKKPVAVQYLEIARQTGLKQGINTETLQQAFKKAYKEQVAIHPNYGSGTLNSPSEWWNALVKNTFSQLVKDVPDTLPQRLYDHFSTAEAYELHPDVQPFLQSIHNLRNQFSEADGPAILTGIITNSDPRVREILRSLSLKVGDVKPMSREDIREAARQSVHQQKFMTPWTNTYDQSNDFDFLVTGYEAGGEKPDARIWGHAKFKASFVTVSKIEQSMVLPGGKHQTAFAMLRHGLSSIGQLDNMRWIHIGDEYEKDYLGARSVGHEALLLDREDSLRVNADKITSLEDAAKIVNVMAQELFTGEDG